MLITKRQAPANTIYYSVDRGDHVLCSDCGKAIKRIYKAKLKGGIKKYANFWSPSLSCDRCERSIAMV